MLKQVRTSVTQVEISCSSNRSMPSIAGVLDLTYGNRKCSKNCHLPSRKHCLVEHSASDDDRCCFFLQWCRNVQLIVMKSCCMLVECTVGILRVLSTYSPSMVLRPCHTKVYVQSKLHLPQIKQTRQLLFRGSSMVILTHENPSLLGLLCNTKQILVCLKPNWLSDGSSAGKQTWTAGT